MTNSPDVPEVVVISDVSYTVGVAKDVDVSAVENVATVENVIVRKDRRPLAERSETIYCLKAVCFCYWCWPCVCAVTIIDIFCCSYL